jgi:hypothetical protein
MAMNSASSSTGTPRALALAITRSAMDLRDGM